jgi:hypothetical protein
LFFKSLGNLRLLQYAFTKSRILSFVITVCVSN